MRLDASNYQEGVPELVAAELVRNVVEPKEFHEFCQFDCLTVLNGDKYYRIPRRPHGLIEVWDAKTRRALDPALRRLPGPGDAPLRRSRHEIPAGQAPARAALEGRRPVQPADRQVRGHAPAALDARRLRRAVTVADGCALGPTVDHGFFAAASPLVGMSFLRWCVAFLGWCGESLAVASLLGAGSASKTRTTSLIKSIVCA